MVMARARTQSVLWARRKLSRLPRAIRLALAIALLLPLLSLTNPACHVIRKPTELFFFVGHRLDKEPSETWRQYGTLFRAYSTSTITPELLAALAQVESSGNPVARTYWRWRLSLKPLAIYHTASSAGGLSPAGGVKPNPQQKQALAAFIHLCGAGPATAYARRHFQMMAGERCGDHLVATYISRVNAIKQRFLRL